MKKNRLMAMVLTGAMCVSMLAGCGGGGNAKQEAGKQEAAETIKIGMLAPMTGGVAQYGIAVTNGAKMYIDEVNANGGINGKKVEVIIYDEEGDTTKALTGYGSLIDQGVTAIIGDVTTAPTVAVAAESQADNMPLITASATATAVTGQVDADGNVTAVYPNVFRSCFIDPFQGDKMAAFAKEKLGAAKVAVLYNTGSDYSVGLTEAFIAKAGELGMEVVANEGYSDGAVDFQGQLTNIAAKSPDVLFCPDYYQVIALVAQQAKDAGVTAAMLGGDGWDAVLSVVSDTALLEGAYYCSGYSSQDTTEAVQTFLANYQKKYESEPNMFAAQGYDAAMILLAAVEKAEATGLTAGSDDYKQAVIDAMDATDMDCITGHVTYDEYNNPEKTAVIIKVENGEATFWGKY